MGLAACPVHHLVQVAKFDVLDAPQDEAVIERVKAQVAALTRDFPVYR